MEKIEKIIAVVNLTGKVGKSTFTNYGLSPFLKNAKMLRLETIHDSGMTQENEQKMRGRDLIKLQDELSKTRCAIVDVGSSNFESFALAISQQDDSHLMIDLFIIPIVNAFKDEAKRTIQTLIALGVSAERIKVVFNKIPSEMDYNIETDMAWIFDFHKKNPHFNLDKEAIIFDSPAFGILDEVNKKLGLSFENMLNDTNDYLQIMRDTSDEKARIAAVAMMRAQGYAKSVNRALKPVFSLLVGA